MKEQKAEGNRQKAVKTALRAAFRFLPTAFYSAKSAFRNPQSAIGYVAALPSRKLR
jgi:hypothetical protein